MSGEELEDTFVISSNHEAQLFKRRNHFDRIVFYDQSTTSNGFLKAPPGNNQERILRHLHEALWDYGYDKRPKNPPCILTGGLNAWIELMGSASLRTSEAVSSRDVTHSVSGFASVATRTHWRPVLDQKVPPINIEEEKKWLEQLQRESDPMTITTSDSLSNVEDSKTRRRATSIVASNTSVQFPRTVEEFVGTSLFIDPSFC